MYFPRSMIFIYTNFELYLNKGNKKQSATEQRDLSSSFRPPQRLQKQMYCCFMPSALKYEDSDSSLCSMNRFTAIKAFRYYACPDLSAFKSPVCGTVVTFNKLRLRIEKFCFIGLITSSPRT